MATHVSPLADRKAWAERLHRRIDTATTAILDLAADLVAAREQLGHGEWQSMVRDDLGRSPRWAQQLMSIARHEITGNAKHASLLPADTNALYELSRLPATRLEELIDLGVVKSSTPRSEVKSLVSRERVHATIVAAHEAHNESTRSEPDKQAAAVERPKTNREGNRHQAPEEKTRTGVRVGYIRDIPDLSKTDRQLLDKWRLVISGNSRAIVDAYDHGQISAAALRVAADVHLELADRINKHADAPPDTDGVAESDRLNESINAAVRNVRNTFGTSKPARKRTTKKASER